MSHNFNYNAKWEIIDENGNIRQTSENNSNSEVEGKLRVEILDNDSKTVLKYHEQPFRSFVIGFLKDFYRGYRISKRNVSFGEQPWVFSTGQIATGSSTSPSTGTTPTARYSTKVYIDAVSLAPLHLSPTISNPTQIILNSVTEPDDNGTTITLTSIQQITNGRGTVREVGLFSDNDNAYNGEPTFNTLIAKDILTTPLNYQAGQYVRILYTIFIPLNNSKVITKNWIYNWVQNLTTPFLNIFRNENGNYAKGITMGEIVDETTIPITPSFVNVNNMNGGLNNDTMGIVIGSGNTNADWNDYKLSNKITSSAVEMEYGSTFIPLVNPNVSYIEGIASLVFFRTFKNNSQQNFIIREAGVIAKTSNPTNEGIESQTDNNNSYLIARWLTGDVVVKPNETLIVYWQPTIVADNTIEKGKTLNMSVVTVVSDEQRQKYPALRNISMVLYNRYYGRKTWYEAKEFVKNLCNEADLGGYDDWRLPKQIGEGAQDQNHELSTILQIYTGLGDVWSDNEVASATSNAYAVAKNTGVVTTNTKTNSTAYGIFAVR